jgi:hypothetical protein
MRIFASCLLMLWACVLTPAAAVAAKKNGSLDQARLAVHSLPSAETLRTLPTQAQDIGRDLARLIAAHDAVRNVGYRESARTVDLDEAHEKWEEFKRLQDQMDAVRALNGRVVDLDGEWADTRKKIAEQSLFPVFNLFSIPDTNAFIRLSPTERRVMDGASMLSQGGWIASASLYNTVLAVMWYMRYGSILQYSSCGGCHAPGYVVDSGNMWGAYAAYVGFTFASQMFFKYVGDPLRGWFVRRAAQGLTAPALAAHDAFWDEMSQARLTGMPEDPEGRRSWLEAKLREMGCGAMMEPRVRVEVPAEELDSVPSDAEEREAKAKPRRRRVGRSRR